MTNSDVSVPPKDPTRTVLRAWARAHDLERLQAAVSKGLLEKTVLLVVQCAMRSGWVDALDLLWDHAGAAPARFLATAWKDLSNGTWSGVPLANGIAVETWLDQKTWGAASGDAHRQAQVKGKTYAMRSALHCNAPARWHRALSQGVDLRNTAGHRLLETLLGAHLITVPKPSPLIGWRLEALHDLLDHQVPLHDDDLLAVFERGDDDLLQRCLRYALDDRTAPQRALLLARSGILKVWQEKAHGPVRAEQWFNAIMARGIVATLVFTPHDVARSQAFDQGGRLFVRSSAGLGLNRFAPTLETRENDPTTQALHVADYWWLETSRPPGDPIRKIENRLHLNRLVETPLLCQALREITEDGTVPSLRRPRARL